MKYSSFLILSFVISITNCSSQNRYANLDSLESSFESVWKDIKMPCTWGTEAKRKTNGKLAFYDKDSTMFEFDFFKVNSLPFYLPTQTDFETIKMYFFWKTNQEETTKGIIITKVEENSDSKFIILKIRDSSGEFYRILARHDDVMCSIKIFDQKIPIETQLDKLKLLNKLNTN
jgi:hypothetical protein